MWATSLVSLVIDSKFFSIDSNQNNQALIPSKVYNDTMHMDAYFFGRASC